MLLASSAGAVDPVSDVSEATAVDTRTMSRVLDVDDKPLDSRSYTIDWSIAGTLNTKKIIGTILLINCRSSIAADAQISIFFISA